MKGILYVSRKMGYPVAIMATAIVASETNQEQRSLALIKSQMGEAIDISPLSRFGMNATIR